ncbi:hypothetical protein BGX38DRAFT_1225637 [Terfezia claveryi]|nr:hypothetical protein BGX38DRAFT_1225637 [Terfezia claveryi]
MSIQDLLLIPAASIRSTLTSTTRYMAQHQNIQAQSPVLGGLRPQHTIPTLPSFAEAMSEISIAKCAICEEVGIDLKVCNVDGIVACQRCIRERSHQGWSETYRFSAQSDMSPGAMPVQLSTLGKPTAMEAMILAF